MKERLVVTKRESRREKIWKKAGAAETDAVAAAKTATGESMKMYESSNELFKLKLSFHISYRYS
jgi:hypothetical protein